MSELAGEPDEDVQEFEEDLLRDDDDLGRRHARRLADVQSLCQVASLARAVCLTQGAVLMQIRPLSLSRLERASTKRPPP